MALAAASASASRGRERAAPALEGESVGPAAVMCYNSRLHRIVTADVSSLNFWLTLPVAGQGLYDVSHKVAECVGGCGLDEALVTVYITHTSASLLIQENADPSARQDLERWLNRLVPEGDSLYTHVAEGADDMPAHIKAALTATSVSIPLVRGRLALGTWQGIFLWEHRHRRAERTVIVNVTG